MDIQNILDDYDDEDESGVTRVEEAGMMLKELNVFFVCIMTLCAKQLCVKWLVLDFWF